jgi:hypothetical protein
MQQQGLSVLFCPFTIVNALVKLSKVPAIEIYSNSHKCQFRTDAQTQLMTFAVRKNTYMRMTKRTWKAESSTQLLFEQCMESFMLGLEAAAILHPEMFFLNYPAIRQGLYYLMLCYAENSSVVHVLTQILDFLPQLEAQRLQTRAVGVTERL